jgi:hypothetical protein
MPNAPERRMFHRLAAAASIPPLMRSPACLRCLAGPAAPLPDRLRLEPFCRFAVSPRPDIGQSAKYTKL